MYFLHEGRTADLPLGHLTGALGYPTNLVLQARVCETSAAVERLLRPSHADVDASTALNVLWQTEDPSVLQDRINELDAKMMNAPPQARMRVVRHYERHPGIARLVKRRESYTCQLCGYVGFQKRGSRERYCEVHHKIHAGRGGNSLSSNLVALCATCHRKAHYGDLTSDRKAKALGLI